MKKIKQILVWFLYALVIAWPVVIWYQLSKDAFLEPISRVVFYGLFFPLAGLMALSFLWIEFTLGAWRQTFYTLFDAATVLKFHVAEGIFTFLFAFIHPLFLFFFIEALGENYFETIFSIPSPLKYYWLLGYLALIFLTLAAIAGILRKNKFVIKYWRWIHYLNYIVMPLVLIHSWFIGSHVQGTAYEGLWVFMFGTYVFSVINTITGKLSRQAKIKQQKSVSVIIKEQSV